MLYSTVRRKLKFTTTTTTTTAAAAATRLLSGDSLSLSNCISAALSPPQKKPETPLKIDKLKLYNKLFGLDSGQNLTEFLHHLTEIGFKLDKDDLVFCVKKLRNFGRYHHSAEILRWMENASGGFLHHGLRLNITYKSKGIGEAEKYFFNLPSRRKKPYIYAILLNCYCCEKMPAKALAVFKKMDKMNCVLDNVVFNNLMGLYMKVDQPEEVPRLVQEMKQRNIPLSSISYLMWLESYGRLKDLAGVEQVMEEVEGHCYLKNDWRIYDTLARVYFEVGRSQRAASALKKWEEVLDYPSLFDRTPYHHLISMYARTGSEESVFQVWGKLNSKFTECQNQSYLVMLQALSKLDSIQALRNLLEEWESRHKSYDGRLPSVIIGAYLRHGMLEEAELLFKDIISRTPGQKVWNAHVSFMDYYLEKHEMESALLHMEAAHSNGWTLTSEKLGPFFAYFKQEKDFHAAESLCNMLEKVHALDSGTYLWLLQTYAAAGEESPHMRQRMEDHGIDISSEHEELLCKISRN